MPRLPATPAASCSAEEARTHRARWPRDRLGGEPVARITGVKEFWGLPLRVTPATLVPRPDTETVVEAALAAIDAGGSRQRALRIADLGTGSGALLLALLSELPNAFGIATDLNVAALEAARDNARRHKLDTRAQFVACDFGAALGGGFDLVVVNPPYVAIGELAGLPAEVRHDPQLCARWRRGRPRLLSRHRRRRTASHCPGRTHRGRTRHRPGACRDGLVSGSGA